MLAPPSEDRDINSAPLLKLCMFCVGYIYSLSTVFGEDKCRYILCFEGNGLFNASLIWEEQNPNESILINIDSARFPFPKSYIER